MRFSTYVQGVWTKADSVIDGSEIRGTLERVAIGSGQRWLLRSVNYTEPPLHIRMRFNTSKHQTWKMHLVCLSVVLWRKMARVLIAFAAHQSMIVVRRIDYSLLDSEPSLNHRCRINATRFKWILRRAHSWVCNIAPIVAFGMRLKVFSNQSRLHANQTSINLHLTRCIAVGRLATEGGNVEPEVMAIHVTNNGALMVLSVTGIQGSTARVLGIVRCSSLALELLAMLLFLRVLSCWGEAKATSLTCWHICSFIHLIT